ncbi:MAG TPA: type II toxin-antitoxin system VapC family toxin [Candidatus Saccharimonadales bacterium]|nr:type II toxin-antitoxin system VapC family toxin [Candidatus Saccharimonadales bacterium]
MSWLVDTDVLSERTKVRPNSRVMDWLRDNAGNIYTSSHVIGEIAAGIERLKGRRKEELQEWLRRLIKSLDGRILNFNDTVAMVWAQQEAEYYRLGCAMPMPDSFIAATARRYNLTIVTRNVTDYQRPGLRVFNPFATR